MKSVAVSALCCLVLLSVTGILAQDVMVGAPTATTHRLNSSAVLVGVLSGPETRYEGDMTQYRVLIDNHDATASIVDMREAMCCKDALGACQVWHGHQNQVVCHGVKVTVDYRVTVVSVGVAANPVTGQTSQVLVPVRIRAGHVEGQHDADLVADPARWEQFRAAALTALVHKEVDRLHDAPPADAVPAPPQARLDLEENPTSGPDAPKPPVEHGVAFWTWMGVAAAGALVLAVLAYIWWWYRREQLKDAAPFHDVYADGGELYLPL